MGSNKNVSVVKAMYVSPLDNFADGKEEVKSITAQTEQNLHLEIAHRKPTIPGKFTKTNDPFIQIGNVIGIDFNEEDKEGSEHLSESSRKVNSEKVLYLCLSLMEILARTMIQSRILEQSC